MCAAYAEQALVRGQCSAESGQFRPDPMTCDSLFGAPYRAYRAGLGQRCCPAAAPGPHQSRGCLRRIRIDPAPVSQVRSSDRTREARVGLERSWATSRRLSRPGQHIHCNLDTPRHLRDGISPAVARTVWTSRTIVGVARVSSSDRLVNQSGVHTMRSTVHSSGYNSPLRTAP